MSNVPADVIGETGRLRIRRFSSADAAFILHLLNTPGFLRQIGDRGVRTLEDARGYIETNPLESYRVNGFGTFLVEDRATGDAIGMCGLTRKPWLDMPDLAYAFLPHAEGRGYASEAARIVVDFAWRSLDLHRLQAIVLPDNAASIKVLDKLSFEPAGTMADPRSGTLLLLFQLRRGE